MEIRQNRERKKDRQLRQFSFFRNIRSQMKVNEMIFMILGLVIFFAIVLMFWLSVSLSGLKGDVAQSSRNRAITLVSGIADSPEFNCVGKMGACVDEDKLAALVNYPIFKSFWMVDGLVIERISSTSSNKTIECSPSNYPRCNTYTLKKAMNNTLPDSSIINLCRVENANGYIYDRCEMGRITVWTKN
jgi:hypothetical protein